MNIIKAGTFALALAALSVFSFTDMAHARNQNGHMPGRDVEVTSRYHKNTTGRMGYQAERQYMRQGWQDRNKAAYNRLRHNTSWHAEPSMHRRGVSLHGGGVKSKERRHDSYVCNTTQRDMFYQDGSGNIFHSGMKGMYRR